MRDNSNNNKRLIEERVSSEQTSGDSSVQVADTTYVNDEETVRNEIMQERDKRIQQEIRLIVTYNLLQCSSLIYLMY